MSMFQDSPELTPEYISALLEKLDDDIAARLVAAAFSMDKQKLAEAVTTACREMEVREQERANQNLEEQSQEINLDLSKLREIASQTIPVEQEDADLSTVPIAHTTDKSEREEDEEDTQPFKTHKADEQEQQEESSTTTKQDDLKVSNKKPGGFLKTLKTALDPFISSSHKKKKDE